MTDQEKIDFLKNRLEKSEARELQLENDIRTSIQFFIGVAKELGINPKEMENINIGQILPGIIMKVSTGSIDMSSFNFDQIKEIVERNKHLVDGIE